MASVNQLAGNHIKELKKRGNAWREINTVEGYISYRKYLTVEEGEAIYRAYLDADKNSSNQERRIPCGEYIQYVWRCFASDHSNNYILCADAPNETNQATRRRMRQKASGFARQEKIATLEELIGRSH